MKIQPISLTLEAYKVSANFDEDAPKWLLDRIGKAIFENSSIANGALRFDGLTVYVRNGKIKERITAKIGDILILRPDGSIAVERPNSFYILYKKAEDAAG